MLDKQDSYESASGLATMIFILLMIPWSYFSRKKVLDRVNPMGILSGGGVVWSIFCFEMLNSKR